MSWYDPTSWNWTGGEAGKDINTKPQQYDYATGQLGQIASSAAGRAAPTITGSHLDASNLNQSRAGLYGVAGNLGAIASGQQQGAGEIAVNRGVGQATAAQTAAARAAHGANAALAFRNAQRNTADIGLAGAGQAAQARAQDQQAANAQLGQIYANAYGQDTSVAQANATLAQQAALANQSAQLQQTSLNDAARIQALGQLLGWDQTTINAQIQKAQVNAQDKGILGGVLQTAGQIGSSYFAGGFGGGGAPSGVSPIGQAAGPITSPNYNDPIAPYRRPAF